MEKPLIDRLRDAIDEYDMVVRWHDDARDHYLRHGKNPWEIVGATLIERMREAAQAVEAIIDERIDQRIVAARTSDGPPEREGR